MKIIYNSRPEFVELQKDIARMEFAMLTLLGEEEEFTIQFDECTEEDFGCKLYLPYSISTVSGGVIKTASLNVAR